MEVRFLPFPLPCLALKYLSKSLQAPNNSEAWPNGQGSGLRSRRWRFDSFRFHFPSRERLPMDRMAASEAADGGSTPPASARPKAPAGNASTWGTLVAVV